jgi:hypothetical protein
MKNFNLHTITYRPMLEKQAWAGICVFNNSDRISKLGFDVDIN